MLPFRRIKTATLRSSFRRRLATLVSENDQFRPGPIPRPAFLKGRPNPEYDTGEGPKRIKIYRPPPSTAVKAKEPIQHVTNILIDELDPSGARQQLFSKKNPEGARAGDILLVRQRNGDSFAGVCLNIRRRGVDTSILLRNELMRTKIEMAFKIYSPALDAIEIVQRRSKRPRRARLFYMRKPKHDIGSVQNLVRHHLRQQASLNAAANDPSSRKTKLYQSKSR